MVEAAKANPDRFAALYDRYHRPIFLFVWRRVQDEATAADVTSTVFLKAMVNLKKYKHRNLPFSSWLYRIAVNETNMHFRKEKRKKTVSIHPDQLKTVVEESELDDTQENLGLLVEAMNDLEPEQAQIIELRFFEKQSFKAIGDLLGVGEATAKMRVYRVLKRMKKLINLKGGKAS